MAKTFPALADDLAISVRSIGKMYRLYDQPQDRLKQSLFWRFGKSYGREFWALRNISFDVRPGEALGIIGRNGSGKSTLLQILAGVLMPTTGQVEVKGRVAALLELASGFNPEYTGRENVFMNGAIWSISHVQMEERFEEIAAFADIGEFMDQPVKTYSSGMLLRLAFAVSTVLVPDVLLVDETLAVGDVFFRQKCYQRLEALRARGVAIVLASHNMVEVEQFCRRVLVLHYGDAIFQGAPSEAVKRYYLLQQDERLAVSALQPEQVPFNLSQAVCTASRGSEEGHLWPKPEAFLDISRVVQVTNGWARCTGVALCNAQRQPCCAFQQGETATFFYDFELLRDIEVPIGGVVLKNDKGLIVHGKSTLESGAEVPSSVMKGSRLRFRQEVALEIAAGEYTFSVGLSVIGSFDYRVRGSYSHPDLEAKTIRLCHLPDAGQFAVIIRQNAVPVQLLHHGIANLPGRCTVMLEAPIGVDL